MAEKKIVKYRSDGEWSAVYVDGKLFEVGDDYWVDEKLFQHLGIEVICSNDFLRGGNYREDVGKTLDEVVAYTEERANREIQASQLRTEAHRLLEQAEQLEQQ